MTNSTSSVTSTTPQLGWIGLGNMGLAMAANLQRHLQAHSMPPLQLWNRTACKADAITALGATQCASIADVVSGSDIIFISVREPMSLAGSASDLTLQDQQRRGPAEHCSTDHRHRKPHRQDHRRHHHRPSRYYQGCVRATGAAKGFHGLGYVDLLPLFPLF